MVHDQGTAFVNQLLEEFTRITGMKNYQTAAMNPRANGVSEAQVKIVSIALSTTQTDVYINLKELGMQKNIFMFIAKRLNLQISCLKHSE